MATAAKKPDMIEGLSKLRAPFPANQISKLPKETRAQIDARKADKNVMVWKCPTCGGAHHKDATHLDYVGHAALTDRLLDTDIEWSWEPLSLDERGLPAFDQSGGLWIKLTVAGVTRLGYGHAAPKPNMDPGAREKEVIGDALRNAAMRFGAALDLWHKGDLHADEEEASPKPANDSNGLRDQLAESVRQTPKRDLPFPQGPAKNRTELKALGRAFWRDVEGCGDPDELDILLDANRGLMAQLGADLPSWIDGHEKDGEKFEGLTSVIERKRTDFANEAWKRNPIAAG